MTADTIVSVLRLGAAGDGLADGADGPLYLAGALPGERVRLAGNRMQELVGAPSSERRTPLLCPHAPRCGGLGNRQM